MASKKLADSVIKKIQMVKLLYDLGDSSFRVGDNIEKVGSGVILLQDAVELFLIALCEHLKIEIDDHISFDKYFVKVEKKMGKEVPFRRQMTALNRQRVIIKHHGVLPNPSECTHFSRQVKDFFIEISNCYFDMDFDSISLVELLNEGVEKEFLKEAEAFLARGEYEECQINCRKVLYLVFEKRFDIRKFEDEKHIGSLAGALYSDAPYFARNKKYIEESVSVPTDYICIDHDKLNMDLLQNDILPVDYWNIWRLTPAVYYYEEDKRWVIEDEFSDDRYNRENAEYCFRKTIEILLLMHRKKGQAKWIRNRGSLISIKKGKVAVYSKALSKSSVSFEFTDFEGDIFCHNRIEGLEKGMYYYNITHELEEDGKKKYISGYIREDDVQLG